MLRILPTITRRGLASQDFGKSVAVVICRIPNGSGSIRGM